MLKPDLNIELKSVVDTSALATVKNEYDKRKKPWCDHCKKYYWKIHAKPPNWKKKELTIRDSNLNMDRSSKQPILIRGSILLQKRLHSQGNNWNFCTNSFNLNNSDLVDQILLVLLLKQGKVSWKMIGSARESGGLYFLDKGDNSQQLNPICLNSTSVLNKVMLWHYRLGYQQQQQQQQQQPSIIPLSGVWGG